MGLIKVGNEVSRVGQSYQDKGYMLEITITFAKVYPS